MAVATETPPKARTLVRCARHRELDAAFRCGRCRMTWCDGCIEHGTQNGIAFTICKCGGGCEALVIVQPLPSLADEFVGCFRYPLRGEGRWLLLVGALLFGGCEILFGGGAVSLCYHLALQGAIGIVLLTLFFGYTLNWVGVVIRTTANGGDELPGFPEFLNVYDSMVLPLLRMIALLALFLGPGLIALPFGIGGLLAGIVLLGAGVTVLPMALSMVAMADNLSGLEPRRIGRAIAATGAPYFFTAALFFAVFGLLLFDGTLTESLGRLAPIANSGLSLYLLAIAGRVLGLIHRRLEADVDPT